MTLIKKESKSLILENSEFLLMQSNPNLQKNRLKFWWQIQILMELEIIWMDVEWKEECR